MMPGADGRRVASFNAPESRADVVVVVAGVVVVADASNRAASSPGLATVARHSKHSFSMRPSLSTAFFTALRSTQISHNCAERVAR